MRQITEIVCPDCIATAIAGGRNIYVSSGFGKSHAVDDDGFTRTKRNVLCFKLGSDGCTGRRYIDGKITQVTRPTVHHEVVDSAGGKIDRNRDRRIATSVKASVATVGNRIPEAFVKNGHLNAVPEDTVERHYGNSSGAGAGHKAKPLFRLYGATKTGDKACRVTVCGAGV